MADSEWIDCGESPLPRSLVNGMIVFSLLTAVVVSVQDRTQRGMAADSQSQLRQDGSMQIVPQHDLAVARRSAHSSDTSYLWTSTDNRTVSGR